MKYFDEIEARVYFEDTDAGGIVYHSKYLNFAERGRTEFLRKKNLEQRQLKEKYGFSFVVKSLNIDYLGSSFLDDLLIIKSYVSSLNKAKVNFLQLILKQNEIIARVDVTVCCVNKNRKISRMNNHIYDILKKCERKRNE